MKVPVLPGRLGAGCWRSLALLLASIDFAAAAEVTVRVARQDNAFQVDAMLLVPVEQRLAWQVLTDYDNLAGFVPGMRSSRIVSGAGEPLLLEQKGESGLLLVKVPIEVVSRIDEAPFDTIGFKSVGEKIFYNRCTVCHGPRDPGAFSEKQWQGITQSMFPRAGLNEDERKLVMEFLLKNAKR